jgi:hypothetical protein
MSFLPNLNCTVTKLGPEPDLYGQSQLGKPTPAKCGVIKLDLMAMQTSVRADSSASRGNADEKTVVGRLLFPANTDVGLGDKVVVENVNVGLEVLSVFPRHTVHGKLDHHQVDVGVWPE